MNDPHLWWYISRASAVIGWALMTLSVVWGILLSTRVMRQIDNPAWLQDLHRYFGGAAIVMVAVHMLTLMLDGWLHLSIAEVLVPFSSHFKALPVALGVTAFYLLVAVQGTSLLMRYLPRRFWKIVHYSSYATLILVSFHAAFTGTDVGTSWYRVVSIGLILLAMLAVVLRLVAAKRGSGVAAGRPTDAARGNRPAPALPETRTMRVAAVTRVADGVLGIRLVPVPSAGSEPELLPAWHPGAHITLHLPNGLERQYSLCGDPAERSHLDIAVLQTETSRGGSAWIHANLAPGLVLEVSGPLNHFDLEPAAAYLFIAGGIGITPIMGMIESLPARRDWKLVYLGRSRRTMAFLDDLLERYPDRVAVFARDEQLVQPEASELLIAAFGGRDALGTPTAPGAFAARADVYCCGPESLMQAVAALVPRERMHFERFVALDRESAQEPQAVTVTCARSDVTFDVEAGESILDALENNGMPILGSCRTGVCGTCEVRVVTGTPDHLDSVMADDEKDSLRVMYPCVSRATSAELVLDI
ncbi:MULTISPECIES: 2Fe-2S iron-sulfur cluster-binding protein [unclassified Cryobacterium]|uniref:2Fe-2S iron-sulfur cluster-binding protein n=1 Tax=unclassified Cryobacterium TaxID=2649013 RepID=UPI002AB43792|nr:MULTISPECIES: 2Fe-2S iron-sulfur cluster-binding protein [unclassified Cryobacterium]MDY7542550.1 2Fe-2S iron-sulfur cluster-binding protein [Cryobacterium sp. 5B3]MEB0264671.1 2Fe-2S iron-sulfur cluster-binding protein [Cryobacterium sp. 10I5]MEB0275171.1 2Fe-2S iron-sulfur cluster-binding protein [Cryobacterium sp. 5B3]